MIVATMIRSEESTKKKKIKTTKNDRKQSNTINTHFNIIKQNSLP